MRRTPAKDPRRRLGDAGEALAARWYRQRGYAIVERNWSCRNGEIDLIVSRGNTVVFCEVKTRTNHKFGHPAEAVTAVKQQRIRLTAMAWLQATPARAEHLRFDVVAVEKNRVQVIEAAF